MAALQPRKHRHRTTFFALFALLSLSAYIFVFHQQGLSSALPLRRAEVPTPHMTLALQALRNNHDLLKNKHPHAHPHNPPLELRAEQELAAVSSFLASLPQNVIPPYVNPARPIEPELVVDFDTRSSRAVEEVNRMVEDVWTRNPVFMYSKVYLRHRIPEPSSHPHARCILLPLAR